MQRTSNKRYYLLNVEIKDYNVIIEWPNVFDHPVKNNKIRYENIRKILVKEMVIHELVYYIMPTLNTIIKLLQ